jgi:hypothetical protein
MISFEWAVEKYEKSKPQVQSRYLEYSVEEIRSERTYSHGGRVCRGTAVVLGFAVRK